MMKEIEHTANQERRAARKPRLVYRYEDGYDAEIHPNFESLSHQFREYAEGRYAAYNVPVWIDYDQERKVPAVSIGVMLTRHGICMLWRSPATPDQFRELQVRMLAVWADRADVQFGRFLIRPPQGVERGDGLDEPRRGESIREWATTRMLDSRAEAPAVVTFDEGQESSEAPRTGS
jgi:hypothetical protein